MIDPKQALERLRETLNELFHDDPYFDSYLDPIAVALDMQGRLLTVTTELCAWIESRIELDGISWLIQQPPALQRIYNLARTSIKQAKGEI